MVHEKLKRDGFRFCGSEFLKMSCAICKKYNGIVISHGTAGCPLASSVLCRRCNHRGHLTSTCDEQWPQWERPTSLEELIPADVRARYAIQTKTPIDYSGVRNDDMSELNTVVIPDPYMKGGYDELKAFIEKRKIRVEKVTKESREKCLEAVYSWGVSNGYRIVKTNEILAY